MKLEQRLRILRRQAGHSVPLAPGDGDLAARIRRLAPSRRQGAADRTAGDEQALAEAAGGRLLVPGLVSVERQIPLDGRHGRLPLCWLNEESLPLPEARIGAERGLVFFDTETSGLAGGTGTQIFLLGLARVGAGSLQLSQYLLTRFAGEPALLSRAGGWLEQAAGLASFNGRSFDAPLLAARARLGGVPDPLAGLPHLDLLHPLRRAFGGRWPDCRLIRAEQRLFGFRRDNDLPGSQAPQAWFDWLRRGVSQPLLRVLIHNRWDLLSLALLLPTLGRVYQLPGAWGGDAAAIARGWSRNGQEDRALELLTAERASLDEAGLLLLARLHKRRRQWRQAGAIWERLAGAGEVEAREQLAKFHEHVSRQYGLALDFTDALPAGPERERRRRRLCRKLTVDLG